MSKNKVKINFSRTGGVGLPVAKITSQVSEKGVTGKFIPCSGDGVAIKTENKYLETLAKIAADSPTHGAAIKWKQRLTFGQGFDLDALPDSLKIWANECNENGDTLNDILERVSWDWAIYESLALVPWWAKGNRIAELRHVSFKNTRIGVPEDGVVPYYIVNNDWHKVLDGKLRIAELLYPFNPEKTKNPDDKEAGENAEQLIYYTTYSPSSDGFYPVPSYAGGLDAALTEVDTIITMKNGISNGINGAYVFTAKEGTVLDDDSKQKAIQEINDQSTGAENSGTVMLLSVPLDFHKMDPIDHEIYVTIDDKAVSKIVTAHNIPAILLEVTTSGGFNNRADEMQAAISQFQDTTILAYQQKITRVFKKILSYVEPGLEFDLKIIPFALTKTAKENEVATKENDGGDTNINS